ncbi:MAG TPA: hypothetical protein VJ304_04650 [Flavobacterium sp.]|nr:hypothetical protein [Flavobacterium sp.]
MENNNYVILVDEWIPIYANVLADLDYNQNLADHLVSIEMILSKVLGAISIAELSSQNTEKLETLGFAVFSLQRRVFHLIPDFIPKQRRQLLALSRETVKEEKFYSEAVLSKEDKMNNDAFLAEIKTWINLVADAVITDEGVLQIILKAPIQEMLSGTATRFSRSAESHGLNLKKIVLFDVADAKVGSIVNGIELFSKPLTY